MLRIKLKSYPHIKTLSYFPHPTAIHAATALTTPLHRITSEYRPNATSSMSPHPTLFLHAPALLLLLFVVLPNVQRTRAQHPEDCSFKNDLATALSHESTPVLVLVHIRRQRLFNVQNAVSAIYYVADVEKVFRGCGVASQLIVTAPLAPAGLAAPLMVGERYIMSLTNNPVPTITRCQVRFTYHEPFFHYLFPLSLSFYYAEYAHSHTCISMNLFLHERFVGI